MNIYAKLGPSKVMVCFTFLIAVLIGSVVPMGLGVELLKVDVTMDFGRVIGVNNSSLGFQLDGDIATWSYRSVLRDLAEDANFKLVRFFEHRLGKPCTRWYESSKTGRWDWSKIDDLVSKIYAIGAEPLIVLGFYSWTYDRLTSAPSGMSSDPVTNLPYPDQWGAYCAEWVRHFKDVGLPVKYYEIINEPHHYFGWISPNTVKLANFVELWNAAARSMRQQNSNIYLSHDNIMVKRVFDYWLQHGDDVDFLDFHKYDSGFIGEYTDQEMFSRAEWFCFETASGFYGVDESRQKWFDARGKWLNVFNSEGNFNFVYGRGTDPKIQQMSGAVWTGLVLRTAMLKGLQNTVYYRFGSSASTESSERSGGFGFGMVNTDNNQPWYPYYVQQMAGQNLAVGDELVETASSSSDVRSLVWLHDGNLAILLICKTKDLRTVNLNGVTGKLNYFKIDKTISWKTPSVQTGTIGSADAIIMNGYTVMLLQGEDSTPPPPEDGRLNVKGYYDDEQVTCNVWYTGPEGSSSTEVAYPPNGHTWRNIPTGSYTVYGEYEGTQVNTAVYVYQDYTTQAQLNFGGPPPPPVFEDDFESGDFSEWTGITRSSGESVAVVNTLPYQGTYHGRFTSDDDAEADYASCYRTIDEEEVWASGHFYVASGLPLDNDDDRFYLIQFTSGRNYLAGVGIRRHEGTDKWVLYGRNGSGWAGPTYSVSPAIEMNRWYCVELHWKKHATHGILEALVNGERILAIEGIDTVSFGNVNQISFGLTLALQVQKKLDIYGDCFAASNVHVGPYALGDINHDGFVDILDVSIVSWSVYSVPDDPQWNPDADLNKDGIINIVDVTIVAMNLSS